MKLKRIEWVVQMVAACFCLPLHLAFQMVGVFVNSCYVGFCKGWQQSWAKGDYRE